MIASCVTTSYEDKDLSGEYKPGRSWLSKAKPGQ